MEQVDIDRNEEGNDHLIFPASNIERRVGSFVIEYLVYRIPENDIDEFMRLGIEVVDDNDPLPENIPVDQQEDPAEPVAEIINEDSDNVGDTLTRFNNVDQWRQHGHDMRQKEKLRGLN